MQVLSVQRNRIQELPLCLGDMNSLQVLKLSTNPITFPPQDILEIREADAPLGVASENEQDAIITAQVKRFLKQKSMDKSETESGNESRYTLLRLSSKLILTAT